MEICPNIFFSLKYQANNNYEHKLLDINKRRSEKHYNISL